MIFLHRTVCVPEKLRFFVCRFVAKLYKDPAGQSDPIWAAGTSIVWANIEILLYSDVLKLMSPLSN